VRNILATNAGYYSVVVSNMAGVATSLDALLTVQPDPENPSVQISYPASGAKVLNATVTMTGKAKDNIAVAEVKYLFNGVTNTATGTTNWSTVLNLTPGTNVVVAWSIDPSGRESDRKTSRFFYNSTNFLVLTINGTGEVIGLTNGQGLLVGRPYSASVLPGTNFVFTNWTGTITSTNPTLSFLMQSNLVLNANFITNPFIATAGNYDGLFQETNVTHYSAGFFHIKLSTRASYSAKLLLDGNVLNFTGKFDLSGTTSRTLSRAKLGKNTLTLSMALDWSTTNETIQGTLTDGNWTSALLGNRAPYDAIYNPTTNFQGRYTMLMPPTNGPAQAPGGYGYALITNNAAGLITISKGAFGDGEVLAQKVPISKFGQWPMYVPAYKRATCYTNGSTVITNKTEKRGSLLGWVTFTNEPVRTLTGTLNWIKTQINPTNPFYAGGFSNQIELIGSAYTPPIGTRILALTNATVYLDAGNLVTSQTNDAILNLNNTVTVGAPNANLLKVSFDLKTGRLKGSFAHPDNLSQNTPFYGAVLQNQNVGAGNFLGTNQTGAVTLEGN